MQNKKICKILIVLLSLATAVCVNLPSMKCSFWLDELSTFYFIKDGVSQAISRTETLPTSSPALYTIFAIWKSIAGSSEVTLRSLSLLSMLACLAIVSAATYRHIGLISSWAFFMAAALSLSRYLELLSFRPYGILYLLQTISLLFLYHRQGIRGWRDFVFFSLLCLLSFQVHYCTVLIIPLQVLLVCYMRRPSSVISLLCAWALALSSLTLYSSQTMPIINSVNYYSDTTFTDLIFMLVIARFPASPIICLILYILAKKRSLYSHQESNQKIVQLAGFALMCGIIPLITLCLLERVVGHQLYYRYIGCETIWLILSACCSIRALFNTKMTRLLSSLAFVGATLIMCLHSPRRLCLENWRDLGALIDQSSKTSDFVYLLGGFDSADDVNWLKTATREYYAIFDIYFPERNMRYFPRNPQNPHLDYVINMYLQELTIANPSRILVIQRFLGDSSTEITQNIFIDKLYQLGYHKINTQALEGLDMVTLQKQ